MKDRRFQSLEDGVTLQWERVADDDAPPDWQWHIVEIAMFVHAMRDCRGWTMGVGHRAWCGHCGWEIAARLDDSRGAATFAMIALARIGEVFTLIAQHQREADNQPPGGTLTMSIRGRMVEIDVEDGESIESVAARLVAAWNQP